MAQRRVLLEQDKLSCSICLNLLKDPVTLPCGHTYCRSCIEGYWDQDEQKGVSSCPQCRESFTPRPALRRNNLLAEVVEKVKEAERHQAAVSELMSTAGLELVNCDVCPGTRKLGAVMSCLVCLKSYCEAHLQSHYKSRRLKRHELVKATRLDSEDRICARHDNLLSESELGMSKREIRQTVQEREKKLKEVQQAVKSLQIVGQAAEQESGKVFTELIRSVERRSVDVMERIGAKQRAEVSQAEELVERLEREIAELRSVDLDQFEDTDDCVRFLQRFKSVSSPSVCAELPSVSVVSPQSLSDVTSFLEALEDTDPEPRTRADLLKYSCPLTLDPDTAYRWLYLCGENRKVTCGSPQSYPEHPDRFTRYAQVLCKEALSGRCYWEVERRGHVQIAVSYKDISRTENPSSGFGFNNKSWGLSCDSHGYRFRHDNVETRVPGPQPSRVGVYLDHEAGSLSFYSVSDTVTLLHKVHTTFTQPLYPGFEIGLYHNIYAEIIKLW